MEENRKIKDYSKDELRKLYKSYSLYLVTSWFKHLKTYNIDEDLTIINNTKTHTVEWIHMNVLNDLRISTISNILNNDRYKNSTEKQRLECERTVLSICNEVLYWCGGGFSTTVQWYKEGKNVENPYDLFNELHMNDDLDIRLGRATKFDIYVFIWETLRHCSVNELDSLLKYADEKFEVKIVGRPNFNQKIYKYDKDDKLIAVYEDRKSCIEANGMNKASLSLVLSGKRKTLKGYKYIEESVN